MAITITVTDTAYGGNGVGRAPDGKAVFVPYTVTGDEIITKIVGDKGSYSVGKLLEIVQPSPWRTEPHCKYHAVCGGCHFGHISYGHQLEIKKNIVLQALRKHSQHSEISERCRIVSGNPVGYRIRASVRTLGGMAGFFMAGTNDFIPVKTCPVMKNSLYEKCAKWAVTAGAGMQTLSVIEAPSGEAIALASGGGEPVLVDFDGVSNGDRHTGKDWLMYETVAGAVPVGYGGFFQSNRYLNDTFQSRATAGVSGRVLELYAGSGFFTAALMKNATVEGIEINKNAAELAQKAGFPVKAADVSVIVGRRSYYDVIFMDPPRDGVDKKTLAAVQSLSPAEIVYVSCNPMTLARDLMKLSDMYRVRELTVFDMFPNTFHVETIVSLQRKNS